MRLFIAEKPTLGRAIADALPKPHKKGDGFIETAQGDVVTWCIGHLLEQAEPDAYDAAFKQWRMEHLPIIPAQWQLVAKPKTKTQLTVIKRLIKQADCVVNAGDPDREGQLLVDEVIDFLGYPKTKPVQRCLISDLNPPAVRRALEKLRDNKEFVPLAVSALARSRARLALRYQHDPRLHPARGARQVAANCSRSVGCRHRCWGWWCGGISRSRPSSPNPSTRCWPIC